MDKPFKIKQIIQKLSIRNIARYVEKRFGRRALKIVFILWLTKWILTFAFGAQIMVWLKGLF